MIARSATTTVLLVALGTTIWAANQFRAGVSVVIVDVAVTSGGRPVAGLNASSFHVEDNGRPQVVEGVSVGQHPLDVTVLLDVSDSVDQTAPLVLGELTSALRNSMLAEDRLRVVPFAARTQPGADGIRDTVERGADSHYTAIYDAIVTAALAKSSPTHRRLIVVLTDGVDTASVVGSTLRRDLVTASDAVVSVVRVINETQLGRFVPFGSTDAHAEMGARGASAPLMELVALSGGSSFELRTPSRVDNRLDSESVRRVLAQAVDSFRLRYTLRFTPSDLTPGAHAIRVKVEGGHVVVHRTSYWQDRLR